MKNKISVKFPFPVRQIGDDLVEISLDTHGIPFPFLETHEASAAEFDKAFGLDMREHEEILERLNAEYHRRLLIAVIRVVESPQ